MSLRRQLLLVSLLTLILPWAGCQFIRETESALREGQQSMLAGTAQAIADSLSQFPDEFLRAQGDGRYGENQIYAHSLGSEPLIDGYFDDWTISPASLRQLRGTDGTITYAIGIWRQSLFLHVDVRDSNIVYHRNDRAGAESAAYSDQVTLVSYDTRGGLVEFIFRTEAPGRLAAAKRINGQVSSETRIVADWQDTSGGYRLEAKIPRTLLGERIGLVITNTDSERRPGIRSSSFASELPGPLVVPSALLTSFIEGYAQPGAGLRLIVTDPSGWRLAQAGSTGRQRGGANESTSASRLLRLAYNLILEPGDAAALAEPDASGREQQIYISDALNGRMSTSWFRSPETGRGIVAVAQPVWSGTVQTGTVILQQGTDAILSLTNRALTRLMNFTLIATLVVSITLLGYSSWLSTRIRRLSSATGKALDGDKVRSQLPSLTASDEIGDLSRSFSSVLQQLGDYNEYLRTLASRLSHELRTPLTIVTSSLENLEHENLSGDSAKYTARAKDGAQRLKKILNAMSEANRVEELMHSAEPVRFDLCEAVRGTVSAYADAWPQRRFVFESDLQSADCHGSPELLIQMLDKLADNAVDFSQPGDTIVIRLLSDQESLTLSVSNPGPPLPATMRSQLFDSMISVRGRGNDEHLGLGLYIARLIAEGHGGAIRAHNSDDGVVFEVQLPVASATI
ncbi:MAG: ATP-binding protein [Gammaproteobacteria bacterium]|nr:ATP-binding protein [Gammaproteobacteria bacterium]